MAFFGKSKSTQKPFKRNVLLVGEANFSFAVAFYKRQIAKQRVIPEDVPLGPLTRAELPSLYDITATELRSAEELAVTYPTTFTANIAFLEAHGVHVLFGVDGRHLHEHPELIDKTFDEIHFNCPHDGLPKGSQVANIIAEFFMSARLLQSGRGQILMILPRQTEPKDQFRKAVTYRLYDATMLAGYELIAKNPFDEKLYPDYHHVITPAEQSTPAAAVIRQYVFRKTLLSRAQLESHYREIYGPEFIQRAFEDESGQQVVGTLIKEQPTPPHDLTPLFTPLQGSPELSPSTPDARVKSNFDLS